MWSLCPAKSRPRRSGRCSRGQTPDWEGRCGFHSSSPFPFCSGSAPPGHPQQFLLLILDLCAEPSLFLSQGFLSPLPPFSPCYPQRMFSLIPIPCNPPQVDATIHTRLAKQFGISGYPSLKIFQPPSKEGEEARAFHAPPLRFHPVPAAVTFFLTLPFPPSLPPSLPLFLPLSPGGRLGQ